MGTRSARPTAMQVNQGRPSGVSREAARVAVTLAWVAGGVDAVGYLTLSHLFTAHMSGNSVAAGSALGQADWGTVVDRGVPIVFFVLGVGIGAAVGEVRRARAARHPFAAVYAVEAALLAAFWFAGGRWLGGDGVAPSAGWPFYAFAALPTLAMGIQSATLRQVGEHRVHTTFVTGVLANLAEALVQVLFRARPVGGDSPAERARLYFSLWLGYLFGAIMGGLGQARWGFSVLLLPLVGLALVAARDVLYPTELGV
jgi:uncharacterized membrane protein YoaK (UPF0700 family)